MSWETPFCQWWLGWQRGTSVFCGKHRLAMVALAATLRDRVEFVARVPQTELGAHYRWADVFVFPTIEDGFPAVMAQACAAGLPQLTTPNGAGRDLISEGVNGWVLPIRCPEAFIERLRWCDAQRTELAALTVDIATRFQQRDWREVAQDFLSIVENVSRTSQNS